MSDDEMDDDNIEAVCEAVDAASDAMGKYATNVVLMALGNMIAEAFTEGYETEYEADSDFDGYIKWLKSCYTAHKSHTFKRVH